jgi:hypothetical protein
MNTPNGRGSGSQRAPTCALSALLFLFLAGCGSTDPLERKVKSSDFVSFSMWEYKAESDLTPDQVADLKQALQEERFHIMAEDKAHGSEAIEDALMETIDGQTLRQVILQGLGYGLDRSEAERDRLEDSLKKNSGMTTRPGDTESASYLSELHDRQVARRDAAAADVRRTRDRIAANTAPAAK